MCLGEVCYTVHAMLRILLTAARRPQLRTGNYARQQSRSRQKVTNRVKLVFQPRVYSEQVRVRYRSCAALFDISNPLRYLVKSGLVWLVLVWFGLVDFCFVCMVLV